MLKKRFAAEVKARSADDGATKRGEFEALVAVYDNVDKHGDRIKSGAFDKTLEEWRASGDPIPIVLAHGWTDPWKHIGFALPEDVKSIPGRGLYVGKGVLDIDDNPLAAQVYRLMQRRTLKEFSFGYNVPDGGEKKASDGAYDLTELKLIEFGPCLKGVNDSTELLAIKHELDEQARRDDPTLAERVAALEKALPVVPTASEEGKAYVDLSGTYEERQGKLRDALMEKYGQTDGAGVTEKYVYIEATYEDHVVYKISGGDTDEFYSVPYSFNDEGEVELGETVEVKVTATVAPKGLDYEEALEAAYAEKAEREASDGEKAECLKCGTVEQTYGKEFSDCGEVVSKESKADEPDSAPAVEPEPVVDPAVKSAQIELMLHEQAIANYEAQLKDVFGVEDAAPAPTLSPEEQMVKAEAELRGPNPVDVPGVRLKTVTGELDAIEPEVPAAEDIPAEPPAAPELTAEEQIAKAEAELADPVPVDIPGVRLRMVSDELEQFAKSNADALSVPSELDEANDKIATLEKVLGDK